MLRDTQLNPAYSVHKTVLSHATARALALGNDITAYGHSVDFVELTARTYSNLPALTRKTAISTAEHLLVDLAGRYPDAKPAIITAAPRRLKDRFIDTPYNRQVLKVLYGQLRAYGLSRREIIAELTSDR